MTYETAKRLKEAGFGWDARDHYPTGDELIHAMPMRQKYLGTVNDAHFVLRKLLSFDPAGEYRVYYEDEDTNRPVPGYEFAGELTEALAELYIAVHTKQNG